MKYFRRGELKTGNTAHQVKHERQFNFLLFLFYDGRAGTSATMHSDGVCVLTLSYISQVQMMIAKTHNIVQ
jgi:hypothetical protein